MEDDRAQVDLGIAADIEETQEEAAALRQPKKRFVGRRQAAEAASRNGANMSVEDSGAVTSISTRINHLRYTILIIIQSQVLEERLGRLTKFLQKS
jgi:hypothetical protein